MERFVSAPTRYGDGVSAPIPASSPSASRELAGALLPWGSRAALGASALNAVWLACFIALQTRGEVAVQAGAFPVLFRVSVGAALLITLLEVPIAAAVTALAAERDPGRAVVGGLFYALYVPVNLAGYFSSGRLAPALHAPPLADDPAARAIAATVEIGHPLAVTGALPLLGYTLLGLGWCLLASALRGRGGAWRAAVPLLFGSGALSVAGGVGAFLQVPWLALGTLLGGVVSLPTLALLGVALHREPRR